MKKIAFPLIYMLWLTIASAQKNIAFNSPAPGDSFLSPFQEMGFKKIAADDFNIKAVRDFVKAFKTVHNNVWSLANNGGSVSTFTSDGIKTKVTYDKKGNRLHIIKIYGENKLSGDIRRVLKREYSDATITMIEELETNEGAVAIYVHMQDKDTWKVVHITDGEMKLMQNFNKG